MTVTVAMKNGPAPALEAERAGQRGEHRLLGIAHVLSFHVEATPRSAAGSLRRVEALTAAWVISSHLAASC